MGFNFKDREFIYSVILLVGGLTGILFPAFVRYVFIVALVVGIGGIGYWVMKSVRK